MYKTPMANDWALPKQTEHVQELIKVGTINPHGIL